MFFFQLIQQRLDTLFLFKTHLKPQLFNLFLKVLKTKYLKNLFLTAIRFHKLLILIQCLFLRLCQTQQEISFLLVCARVVFSIKYNNIRKLTGNFDLTQQLKIKPLAIGKQLALNPLCDFVIFFGDVILENEYFLKYLNRVEKPLLGLVTFDSNLKYFENCFPVKSSRFEFNFYFYLLMSYLKNLFFVESLKQVEDFTRLRKELDYNLTLEKHMRSIKKTKRNMMIKKIPFRLRTYTRFLRVLSGIPPFSQKFKRKIKFGLGLRYPLNLHCKVPMRLMKSKRFLFTHAWLNRRKFSFLRLRWLKKKYTLSRFKISWKKFRIRKKKNSFSFKNKQYFINLNQSRHGFLKKKK